jgi:hypothetical protein
MKTPSAALRQFAAIVLITVALTGCATLSESECRSGAWSDVGFRDGRSGRVADRISEHAKACSEYGIVPDRAAYFEGRDEGLVQYCTMHNGFLVGSKNESYEGVCAVLDERQFLAGFNPGRELYRARERLSGVEADIARIDERRKKDGLSDADRSALIEKRIALEGEHGEARAALERLEWETKEL